MAKKYDTTLSKAPVERGDLWDLIIRQEQIMLTLLQTISAVKDGNAADYKTFSAEVMERIRQLDELRDALIYRDEP